jgi:Zinc finger, C2H2 type
MAKSLYRRGLGVEVHDERAGFYIFCKICDKDFKDRSELIEHLRMEHEILELASYAAATMAAEQERDRMAGEFRRRFELLKRELAGHEQAER